MDGGFESRGKGTGRTEISTARYHGQKMNFWWVNHKKTFRQEFDGKYIWSPKRKRNGHINPFYETMREVQAGDIIFSFAGAAIRGFGIARTHCYPSPRPDELAREVCLACYFTGPCPSCSSVVKKGKPPGARQRGMTKTPKRAKTRQNATCPLKFRVWK
jgi:hypothetical protein